MRATNTYYIPKSGTLQQPVRSGIMQPKVNFKGERSVKWYEDKLKK